MSVGRGILFKGFVELFVRTSSLITFPILARYAGAEGYGAYGQLMTIVGFVIPFASMGLSGAMVRFFSNHEWNIASRRSLLGITWAVALLSGAFTAFCWLLAEQINNAFLKWEYGVSLFRYGALLIFLGAVLQLQLDFLRARGRYVNFSAIQFAETSLLVLATITLLPNGYGILYLVKINILIKTLIIFFTMSGYWVWDRPSLTNLPQVTPSLTKMVRFGLPIVFSGLGLWLMNLGDRLVIGNVLSPASLGVYGAVYSFAALIIAVSAPFFLPLYPRLMRAFHAKNAAEISRNISLFHRYICLAIFPTAIALILYIKPLLLLMGGGGFVVGFVLIAIIVFSLFLDQWNGIAHYVLICNDQMVYSQNVWLVMGGVNLIGNMLVVPYHGLLGAALVTLITFVGLEWMMFARASKYCDLKACYRLGVSIKALMASLLALGIASIFINLDKPTLVELIISMLVFGLVYTLSMWRIGEVREREFQLLFNAFKFK